MIEFVDTKTECAMLRLLPDQFLSLLTTSSVLPLRKNLQIHIQSLGNNFNLIFVSF